VATQLGVYNRALTAMGARRLASLTEPRLAQRVLTDLWADVVQYCLEQGMWNFAMTAGALASAGSGFGFSSAFSAPTDQVHLFTASLSPSYDPPLVEDFIQAGPFYYANGTPLYVRYSSNSVSFGGNLLLWTGTFETFVSYTLAAWAAFRITGSQAIEADMVQRSDRALLVALSIDHVPQLPGLRPFNAEARARVVQTAQGEPIEMRPFHAALMAPPQQGQG